MRLAARGPAHLQIRPGWQADAACVDVGDPEMWHASRDTSRAQVVAAKRICASCPVKADCLREGMQESGIWGGLTQDERRHLQRTRRVA